MQIQKRKFRITLYNSYSKLENYMRKGKVHLTCSSHVYTATIFNMFIQKSKRSHAYAEYSNICTMDIFLEEGGKKNL